MINFRVSSARYSHKYNLNLETKSQRLQAYSKDFLLVLKISIPFHIAL